MGLFSKGKDLLGGKGVTVEFTRLERQDPATASFPVTDSVFKGNYVVKADKDAVILKHKHRAYIALARNGYDDEHPLSSSVHDKRTDIIGADIKWPYKIKAGETKQDGFLISDIDIPAVLQRIGIYDPNVAVHDPSIRLVIEVVADVKGSPFDPKAKVEVALTGDEASAPSPQASAPKRPLVYYEDGYYPATILESNPQGHHIQWDDGTDSWEPPQALLPTWETPPHPSQLAPGQTVVAFFQEGFYRSSVKSVDPGDMVNPAKVLILWDDQTESWVSINDVRMV